MNKIKTLLAVALLGITCAVNAQFYPGPWTGPALLTTTPFFIPGSTTTNVAAAYQFNVPVGPLGVGFFLEMGATNAASTTNCTITLEATVDGTYWIDSPTTALPVLSIPQNGTSPYTVYTNLQATAANLGNLRHLRVKSIQNTNVFGIFITNFTASVR
jgi:hypothetical protein